MIRRKKDRNFSNLSTRAEIEEHIKIYTSLITQQQEFVRTLQELQQHVKGEDFDEQIEKFRELIKANTGILEKFRQALASHDK